MQVSQIDSKRMVVHVRAGKGAKDRYVPLPQPTLTLLRCHWKTHRHPKWLFPAPGRSGTHESQATRYLPLSSVQTVFKKMLTCIPFAIPTQRICLKKALIFA